VGSPQAGRRVLTAAPYPPLEPHAQGLLDVGDGHRIHWETCGTPDGKPAVVVHGGPGSGCTPAMRRLFDPRAYRIVLFDQRGAGRSLPHASDPATSLAAITTDHLAADLERLREHLGVGRWLVHGGSWGSTLALVYAQRHPERVSEIVLAPVTLTRRADVEWLYHGVGRFLPAEWARFRAGGGAAADDRGLVDAYARLLADPDPAVRERAAREWCAWEDAIVAIEPGGAPSPRYDDPRFRLAFARIVTHVFRHGAWLRDGELLDGAHRLAGIPGVLIQGRLDLAGPPAAAWELAQAWPGSELVLIEGAGHAAGLREHVLAATDRFR
jgi:proline iminopeptidase